MSARLWTAWAVRVVLALGAVLALFTIFLAATGRDPAEAYSEALRGTFGSRLGLSELALAMVPLVLTALAAALPARVGIINVGAEGQFYLGAWAATGVALFLTGLPAWSVLPLMTLAGFAGGVAWAALAAALRSWRGVHEIVSTLMLNYVAILFVSLFVFGPWKNPQGVGYPYTESFSEAATFVTIGGTRLHVGVVLPVAAVLLVALLLARTRWGFHTRAIGGNAEAARRQGIPVARYLVVAMLVGGGLAGLAGMAEVAGVQHHLRPGVSENVGYLGFLASWVGGHKPVGIVMASFLLALLMVAGDVLQISVALPSAAVSLLAGMAVLAVLAAGRRQQSPA
ncbi:MAG: ABC transporter permease [Dehalococcoidia bacterium]|nr:ABC transporter permease [Dehalococcoidia bacterium]